MKKLIKIITKVLISLTVILVLVFLLCRFVFREQIISYIEELQYKEYVEKLVNGGAYNTDKVSFAFTYDIDESISKEIRDFFKLDSIVEGANDTWSKTMKIAQLAGQIPHGQPAYDKQPKDRTAIYLWKWSKENHSGFNCRLHGIMLHEMLLSEGIINRVVTCLPGDSTDNECHVVNNVWIPEKKKWMMIDSDQREYATDENGNVLSLAEMRYRIKDGKPINFRPLYNKDTVDQKRLTGYWAKNLYHFCCIENTSYGAESKDANPTYIDLVPHDKSNLMVGGFNSIFTTDDKRFWATPKRDK